MSKYAIEKGSRSLHDYCFEFTIVDTSMEDPSSPRGEYFAMAEVYSLGDAELICNALNFYADHDR